MHERGRKNYEYARIYSEQQQSAMGSNQLKMNASKTELILFDTNHQLKKITSTKINVCGENIKSQKL